MRKLVVHHTYETAVPFDVSRCGNHGVPQAVAPDGAGSFVFTGGSSRVKIPLSDSLRNLRSIRVCVRFNQHMAKATVGRNNLVEGHLSFALMLQPDGSLHATILDRNGDWRGPRSAAGMIKQKHWHTADFRHDGISHARLFLDGALVAERFDVPGPVRTPGPNGIVVGAWPEPDNRYTLQGHIDDVMIYKHDPKDAMPLLDECCFDREAADDLATKVRAAGWDHAKVDDTLQRILDLGTEASIVARGNDPVRTKRLSDLTKQGALAVKMGDAGALSASLTGIQDMIRERVGAAELKSLGQRAWDQMEELPIFEGDPVTFLRERSHELAEMLCLDEMVPPRRPRPRKPRPRPEGDPDTDRPEGEDRPGWDKDIDDEPDPNSPVLGTKPDRPRDPVRPKPRPKIPRPQRPQRPQPKPRRPGDDD